MALTADRNTHRRDGDHFEYDAVAADIVYAGALAVLNAAGTCEPGTSAAAKIAAGRCEELADNSAGAAGAIKVKVRRGVYKWANSSGDAVTAAQVGDTVYIEDDQTVSGTSSTQSAAGICVQLDSDGVWVDTRPPPTLGLLAANNLSDVGTVATARANLGLDTGDSPTFDDLTVAGLATVAETLGVTGVTTMIAGHSHGTADEVLHKTAEVSLTGAEIKALATSPHTLVAAVAGKMLVFKHASLKFSAGSEILVEPSAPDDPAIRYTDGSGTIVSTTIDAGILFASAGPVDAYGEMAPILAAPGVLADRVNTPLVLDNTGTDYTGNATEDAVLKVNISYMEVDMS